MKLRTRIALAYVALVAVALVGLAIYLNHSEQDRLRDRIEEDMADEARLVALAVGPLLAEGAPAAEVDAAAKRLGQADRGRRHDCRQRRPRPGRLRGVPCQRGRPEPAARGGAGVGRRGGERRPATLRAWAPT